ncbi:MAG: 30S ribosomal protein S11 [Candidatus Niyogibacteria bacterium RIFCSPLOWO2_12_FULL_41_13]|uniref:Small ribosomal subunit protein uS11 n=1 Tax=Candidatus Niyogibacteria bacterium RIFCSPLOWO2_12_FULL_41_13 TaxID=1801726 RepID=A0A1G2F1I0_9BACT|nr:MAG: 30S ribosomal protein S11 [Candidatus Niyogibacteria bacterium RIFCSPLOWO2_12_FULL_41_13]
MEDGFLYVNSSYNNTILSLTDEKGNVAFWASAGSLGFKGTKKGTPFAASKAAELVADKTKLIGIKNIDIVLKGIGAGRESAIRAFINRAEINVKSIKDVTPIPHGGVKAPKPRRV